MNYPAFNLIQSITEPYLFDIVAYLLMALGFYLLAKRLYQLFSAHENKRTNRLIKLFTPAIPIYIGILLLALKYSV